MSRMYNTVGATGAILSTGFNSKETTYLLFAHEQAYLTYLKKIIDKVYSCQAKRVGDKYKFLLS